MTLYRCVQCAINDFLKVELLIEFAEWLYCNELPLQNAVDQLDWAIDILFNMTDTGDCNEEQNKSAPKTETVESK